MDIILCQPVYFKLKDNNLQANSALLSYLKTNAANSHAHHTCVNQLRIFTPLVF